MKPASTGLFQPSLLRTRKIVEQLLARLEAELDGPSDKIDPSPYRSWLWGEKENAVSVVVKLGQLMVKLSELERESPEQTDSSPSETAVAPMTDQDWSILERYIAKRKRESFS